MGENLRNFFKVLFEDAHRLVLLDRLDEANDICHSLLREPSLPLLYRAGCNLMLSLSDDNAVEFAKEAVSWYQEMYDEVQNDPVDGPHHLALLRQAQEALEDAEERMAEQNQEDGDGETTSTEDNEAQDTDVESVREIGEAGSVSANLLDSSFGGTTVVASSSPPTEVHDDADTIVEGHRGASSDDDEE